MPAARMARCSPRLLITVATNVLDASSPASRIASARITMIASPSMTRPAASTARQRSASPSCASPRSAPWDTTADCSTSMCVDPQPSLMFSPSGSALIAMTFAPAARYARGAAVDAAPCAQSTTTVRSSSRVVSALPACRR